MFSLVHSSYFFHIFSRNFPDFLEHESSLSLLLILLCVTITCHHAPGLASTVRASSLKGHLAEGKESAGST